MQSNKILKTIIIVLVIAFASYIVYVSWPRTGGSVERDSTSTETVVCTMEAKLCLDGSYVGRSGPDCEFAPCPTSSTNQSGSVTTSTASNISFQYPKKLDTKYISLLTDGEFTPEIKLSNQPFNCREETSPENGGKEVEKRVIDGRDYCISRSSEGAAGSSYVDYNYAFAWENKTVVLDFTLRFSGCYNYDELVKTECEKEQKSFNVDMFADGMARTIKI